MGHAPITGGPDDWEKRGPIRTAGIAPGPAQGTPMDGPVGGVEEVR